MATGARLAAAAPLTEEGDAGFPPLPQFIGFLLMAFGMFMAILDIQIVSASLSQIQAGLAASADEVSWVQTSYLVAEVVMIPLSGFLARALSTRWLFVISAGGFTVASFLCSTATSIEEMIVYRALQGFLGGAMIPTVYAASFAMFGRKRQTGVTVAVSLIVTLAPTIGPALGGWMSETFSWHWLFLINIVPGILITFGVWALVDFDKPDLALLKKVDIAGLVGMALFLGGLDFVLEEGARNDWFADPTVFRVAVAAVFGAMLFVWRQRTAEVPIVDLRAFRNLNFMAGTLMGATFGIGLYGLVYLYPLYLSRVAAQSSGQIGGIVFVTGLFMAMSAPIVGNIARKVDPRAVLTAGFLLLALSTWLTHGITNEWRFWELFWPQAIRGVALICCIVSISVTSFATLAPERLKDASGLFTLMRNLGGAVGLALINTVVLWRFNLHWSRLGEQINPGVPVVQERLEQLSGLAASQGIADPDAAALRQVAGIVSREALVMSYADCFTLLTIMFLVAACVPFLLRRPPTFEGSPPDAH
ncbi:DHA2 family efflux MFS transporter permease subunit [Glacieibacterium frigidum]|uniref:DHA2 family efflux MFS transporter permease subunit n=1 Tax=Glacieibacterium frigidum TaxID=2593303 RepID=A0A552UHI8_9SPHN|nr:DHA2 family efflux MFS transporter permease subunit [Glacieibacterium frigidum]TRW17651.1 DHA2 family efflux MFS transporter permease subunit [Glacieibacterium frigidum]